MPSAPRDSRFDRVALVAVVVGTVILRASVVAFDSSAFSADLDDYRQLADNLAQQGVYGYGDVPTAFRPPLYPLALALLACMGLLNTAGMALLHVVLGTATVWLSTVLGRQWGLGRWRFAAAALVACDPILVRQSTLIMSETQAAFMAAAGLVTLTALVARPTAARALIAGATLGMAVLCRPAFLVWVVISPAAVAWLLPRGAPRLRAALLVAVAALAVLVPWGARNALRFGRPIITTTHGGFTLLLANNPEFYAHLRAAPYEPWDAAAFNRAVFDARRAAPDENEAAADRRAYAEAWRNIRAEPGMFLWSVAFRKSRLWGVLPMGLAHESSRARSLRYATAAFYALEFALAFVGLWGLGRKLLGTPWLFGLLLAASFTTVQALYWTDLRMRAPLVPAIACAASAGAAWIYAKFSRRNSHANK